MNKFKIKELLDNCVFRVYNALVTVIFLCGFKTKKLLEKNRAYENKHQGERCFILGTGPSLSELSGGQIETLKRERTFGLNSLYKADIGKAVRPDYYALVDNNYWEVHQHTYAEVAQAYGAQAPVFITDPRAKPVVDSVDRELDAIYVYAKKYPVSEVSLELHRGIHGLMNVVSVCIVSAMYMGFKEIYLLGCDYNAFCSFGRGHCYDDDDELAAVTYNLAFYLKYYHLTTEFHYLIAKLAKKHGVKIVNLTDVSLLDAYPRRPVSTVL
ncbi:DUF115 domain-containing protein [Pseudomonas mosselii]|uniref:6-hydroxymethylpterin diphosphokinase MptE-like protein n=1 Tax=Pseudomonas mosselii TaxID=78327 RepID=UPI000BB4947C|nr:6-hydroxymethylpterin diphosphokinase MptE-like protein [Pseudomonas mosselii]ATB64103.1 hypothetical protein CLJ08_05560 [Pseudomonas mosselii]MDH1099555.1 DUF115 domain-containing protein [Pseudomonas mosselii]MEB5934077.1 DUF115 domain-containing protein [Pseudomonas mosselii]